MRLLRIALLALAGLRRTPLRVVLTALGVAIASGALVSMVGFALGMERQVEAPFVMLGLLNNIDVSPKTGEDVAAHAPVLDDAALKRMEAIPGVTAAYPDIRMRDVKIVYEDKTKTTFVMGVPRQATVLGPVKNTLVAGRYFSDEDRPEMVVGEQMAHELGADKPAELIGKTITLEASGLSSTGAGKFTFEKKKLSVTVVGIYRVPPMVPQLFDRGVLLPIELMKSVPGVHFSSALERLKAGQTAEGKGYANATVRVRHFSDLAPVQKAIDTMGFKTRVLLDELQQMRRFFVFMDVLLAAVGTVALVVAALGIVNTLLMAVLERQQEIGVYKTIGASNGDVLTLFLTEAGFIGLLGGFCGLVLGAVVSWGLGVAANVYARSQGVERSLDLFAFPAWLLVATVLFAIIISVLAGVYPAMRAARIDPIRALREG